MRVSPKKAWSSRNLSVIASQLPSKVQLRIASLTACSGPDNLGSSEPPPQPAITRAASAAERVFFMPGKVGALRVSAILLADDLQGGGGFPPTSPWAPRATFRLQSNGGHHEITQAHIRRASRSSRNSERRGRGHHYLQRLCPRVSGRRWREELLLVLRRAGAARAVGLRCEGHRLPGRPLRAGLR